MTKKITRQTAKEISDKISAFVNSLEAEYGIKAGKRSSRYSDASVKVTIDCVLTDENRAEGVLTVEEQAYDLERHLDDRLPERKSVIENGYGEKFVVIQWMPRGRKFKVVVEKLGTDKRYKFTKEAVIAATRI